MTTVLPTLREKKRYLVFEVIGSECSSDAVAALKESFSSLFGVIEAARANTAAVKMAGPFGVVRTNRKYVDKVKASLAMIKSINNKQVIMRSVGVSGTLRTAVSKYVQVKGG